jgi:hypothetical protein
VNPFLSNELARERIRDLHMEAGRTVSRRSEDVFEDFAKETGVTVRRFAERDIDAVRRLAALDEKPVPVGGVLVAEQGGELVAALPLDGRPALADPFKPTADIVRLLKMRARQLGDSSSARTSRRPLIPRGRAPRHKLA